MTEDHPILSLTDLERHHPNARGRGRERRFLCPLPACADHQDGRRHRNLSANLDSGLWHCCRCDAGGKLTEKWEPRERLSPRARARRIFGLSTTRTVQQHQAADVPQPEGQRVPPWRRRWDAAVPIAGTPGADYLASRGIPEAVATAAGVRYLERWEHWARGEDGALTREGTSRRVVFPIVDQAGEPVGIHGRVIADEEYGESKLTNGTAGVFSTVGIGPVGPMERLAVVEAPIDALSLAVVGIPALSTQGTSWPEWLPRALAFKTVLLAHDNDEPDAEGRCAGDEAAAKLDAELGQWGARSERWQPTEKDWNATLQVAGAEALRELVGHVPNPGPNPADDPGDQVHQDDAPACAIVAPYPPPPVLEQPTEAAVAELVAWLASVPRPVAAFDLWPWARVVDAKRFYAALQADISQGPTGPRWLAAVDDLRQLARLFSPTGLAEAAA